MVKFLFTITSEHVGKSFVQIQCPTCEHTDTISLGSAIGRVQPQDIGKQVWHVNGVIQVENNEQRDRRIAR